MLYRPINFIRMFIDNNLCLLNVCLCTTIICLGTPPVLEAADILIPSNQITETTKARYFVVAIGVNNYQDQFWPTLKWPASDATRIIDKLGTSTRYKVSKKLLLNEFATLDSVTDTLNWVAQESTPDDIVVLYISSHGTLTQSLDGYLKRVIVLHDSQQQQLHTSGLAHAQLNQWLQRLNARKKMMIFASCHSGEGKSRLPASVDQLIRSQKGKLIPLSDASEGALVLAAAAKGEAARENDNLQGDIYTHYLLEALNVFDRNKDGMVSALEAHDYARERTWAFTQGKQRPTANVKFIGDADIPMLGKKSGNGLPVLEAYNQDLSGFFISVDNGVKGRLPLAFPLDPNGSHVSLYTPGGKTPVARYKVTAKRGTNISLYRLMNHRPYSLGLHLRRFQWLNEDWEKLTGTSASQSFEFEAGYYWKRFGFKFLISSPQDTTHSFRPQIRSDAKLRTNMLLAEYRYTKGSTALITRMGLGTENVSVKLTDNSTNTDLSFTDNSTVKSLSFLISKRLKSDLHINFEAGFRQNDWDLGLLGNLSGERRWLSLGLSYQFGWNVKTL